MPPQEGKATLAGHLLTRHPMPPWKLSIAQGVCCLLPPRGHAGVGSSDYAHPSSALTLVLLSAVPLTH